MLIALIPAITWGSIGLVSGKIGGNANQQTLGMTMGALVFSLLTTFIFWSHIQAHLSFKVGLVGLISGLFWSLGQNQQFHSMKAIGISKTVPLSTGLQLLFNALAGVVLFHEWRTRDQIAIGSTALVILIIGATLTSLRDKKAAAIVKKDEQITAGIRALALSTVGYVGYTVVVNWAGVDAKAMVLPQALGMVVGASLFAYGKDAFQKETFKNIVTGLVWGTGNIFMFLAIPAVGLAISYSFSQMGIIISTFGSILLLGEKKTKKELIYITIGSLMIISGGVLLSRL
ncbi:GRP family sugar transporter [Liquorilactobacillus capillatus]|uniref:Sugar transport n=1 Tax=Liquorilactobacillus capillatus DSM 19910 TaxID=1423731 RepID=A0A0R1M4H5_9LACO|nr:GRP family sugar transporter [Liquorilactobacillus capillatus]KRL02689.1 Sugar transport [Liquorilactobacillus capillatus DSM 19910]